MAPPIPATRFKATCLSLLDRVADRHESFVISKRGRPVARLVPIDAPAKPKRGPLVGSVTIVDPDDDLLCTGLRWDIECDR